MEIVTVNAPRATACDQHGMSSSMSAIDEAGSAVDAGLLAEARAAALGLSLPPSDFAIRLRPVATHALPRAEHLHIFRDDLGRAAIPAFLVLPLARVQLDLWF
jgi:hypothetical protein